MNEQFNLNKTPTTIKPSAERYNTLMLFIILIILLLAFIHIYINGLDMNVKVPGSNDAIITKKEVSEELMESARKVKEHLTEVKEDPTTMQQVYYYGKFILGFAVVVGVLYLCYKYEMSMHAPNSNIGGTGSTTVATTPPPTTGVPLNIHTDLADQAKDSSIS